MPHTIAQQTPPHGTQAPRPQARGRVGFLLFTLLAMPALALRGGTIETRDGKTYTGQIQLAAPDGVSITPPGGAATRVPFANLRQATFVDAPPSPATRPAFAQHQDIGRVHTPGSVFVQDGTIAFEASGWGIWGPADSFHFLYQPFRGDGQLIARVCRIEDPKGAVIAGLSFRESLDPAANHCSLLLAPPGEARLKSRPGKPNPFLGADVSPRFWLRLARQGDTFWAYTSNDGRFWDLLERREVPLPADVLIGLAASTAANAFSASCAFDRVLLIPGPARASYFPDSPLPGDGLVLRDGTVLAAAITAADRSVVRFARSGAEPQSIPLNDVAVLLFNPSPSELAQHIGRPIHKGLLLNSGDQIDGELASIAEGAVAINSVLLGLKKFNTATDAIALTLAPATPPRSGWMIQCTDRSRFYSASFEWKGETLVVEHPHLGRIALPVDQIATLAAVTPEAR